MKEKKIFQYCEYCGKAWEVVYPLSKEQCKQGFITIKAFSSVLLKKRKNLSHHASLDGVYCNAECLMGKIKEARGEK